MSWGLSGISALALLASIWTMPWDNLMVLWNVWSYPEDAVLGTVFLIPLEEQLFFVIQPLFTGMWILMVYPNGVRQVPVGGSWRLRGVSALFALSIGGAALYLSVDPKFLYLGSFCAWFSIPIAIQWAYGAHLLCRWPREIALGVLPPTLYLCVLDSFAIRHRVWSISEDYTTGVFVGTLPIEEVLFFLFTNLLVVQGLYLFYDLMLKRSARLSPTST